MPHAEWRKSSYSDGENTDQGNCVEVNFVADLIGVRDSKSPADGALSVAPSAWRSFLADLH